jgi:dihydrofolate reductase
VAIKTKFAKEFWLAGGSDIVKTIAQAKLAEVFSFARFRDLCSSQMFQFLKASSLFPSFLS